MKPNKHGVYHHDSPEVETLLWGDRSRAYCEIRLLELAAPERWLWAVGCSHACGSWIGCSMPLMENNQAPTRTEAIAKAAALIQRHEHRFTQPDAEHRISCFNAHEATLARQMIEWANEQAHGVCQLSLF